MSTPHHSSADLERAPSALDGLPPLPGDPSDPFEIDVRRCSPPPELDEQIAEAQRIHARLRARGLEIRFSCAPDRAPEAALYGGDGRLLRVLSPAEAADIAAGRTTP